MISTVIARQPHLDLLASLQPVQAFCTLWFAAQARSSRLGHGPLACFKRHRCYGPVRPGCGRGRRTGTLSAFWTLVVVNHAFAELGR